MQQEKLGDAAAKVLKLIQRKHPAPYTWLDLLESGYSNAEITEIAAYLLHHKFADKAASANECILTEKGLEYNQQLSNEDKEEVIESIKKEVETSHSVSVIEAIARYKDHLKKTNPDFAFPIDNGLVETISKAIVIDPRYQRIPKDKDYFISYRDVSDRERIQLEALQLQIQDLLNKVVDYYEIKARARRAELISVLMGLVALAALIVAIVK